MKRFMKFILGGAGTGKSTELTELIKKAAQEQNDKKIIVIVPEQFSFDSDKKLYSALGAYLFNRITACSFTTLSENIFKLYGGRSGEYADDTAKLIIMNSVLRQLRENNQLTYFNRQCTKPGFVNEMLDVITEFRRSGSGAEVFGDMTADADPLLSQKISELSLIYCTYNKMLDDSKLRDSLTDISEAAALAQLNDFFRNTLIFIDEFESFTGDELNFIEAAAAQAEGIYISLRLDNTGKKENDVFETVRKTWAGLYQTACKYNLETENIIKCEPVRYNSPDLAHLNMNILRPVRSSFGENSTNIRITECADLYEEAEWICSEIKRLVREENYSYRDIAVMSRQLDEYTYIFEDTFERYNIPFSIDVRKSVMHTSIMQYVTGLIGAVSEKKLSSEMIFRYAKAQLSGIPLPVVSALENYCFEWDIDGGKWTVPFTKGYENEDIPDYLKRLEETRKSIIEPLTALRERCKKTDCKSICRELYSFIKASGVPERVKGTAHGFKKMELTYLSKEFIRIWDIFVKSLDSVAAMGGDMKLSEFNELLTAVLAQASYSVPPQTLDGVRIYRAETSRPDNPKALFLAGVNEDRFPAAMPRYGILDQRDREYFLNKGVRISRTNEEITADERLVVYKTLTHPSERLYITYPLTDTSGSLRYPSTVLAQITGMFGEDIRGYANRQSIIDYCGSPEAAYTNLVRHFGENSPETESIKKALKENEEYRARIEYLETAVKERKLMIEDENLMKELFTRRLEMSPTALEEYNMCHFKYFCHAGLRLRLRQKRTVDRMAEGNLTHRCLEMILKSCSTKEELEALDDNGIKKIITDCSREFLTEIFGEEAPDRPGVIEAVEKISDNIRMLVYHLKSELLQSKFFPTAFELDITEGRNTPVLKIGEGENAVEVYLKGTVDRVDIYEKDGEKYIRVIDYKTGKKEFSFSSILYGINMQMLLYLFSVTDKGGRFEEYQPAGILYMPSGGVSCTLDRNSADDDIADHYNEHYKMNGVLLNDRAVLNAMEKNIKGIYIPAALKSTPKKGVYPLTKAAEHFCITKAEFEKLRRHTDRILEDMCRGLYGGDIEASPYVEKDKTPCSYCEYWSVCGNTPQTNCRICEEKPETAKMIILGGDENGEE